MPEIVGDKHEEKNIRLVIVYDGTGYFGWQRQVDRPTIQGIIEKKIRLMVSKPVSLIASGRTDAGVHALRQVANFRVASTITPAIFLRALNSLLPDSITIAEAVYVPLDFHSRYDARSKVYQYRIHTGKMPSPFLRNYAWHVPRPLDLKAMKECLVIITGAHDFSSFCSVGDGKVNPVRTMIRAELRLHKGSLLTFDFEANGFLRYMVRTIVGAIVKVGLGEISVDSLREILTSKDRQHPGIKAPPGGLYLKSVKY